MLLCFLDGLQQIQGMLRCNNVFQFTSWSTHNKERDCNKNKNKICWIVYAFKRIKND